jgi:hypothetical protein
MRPIPLLAAAVEPSTHRLPPGLLRRAHPRIDGWRSGSQAVEAAEDELLIRLHLAHRTRRPRVLIDGHLWEEVRWIVTPNGDGWNAVAVLGLEHLPIGVHEVRIEPPGHPVTILAFRHLPE